MVKSEEIIMPTKMIQDILKKMSYGGHNPTYQNIYTKVYSYIIKFLFLFSLLLQIIYIFTTNYEEFGLMITDIVIIAATWQISIKCIAAHWKQKYILELIDIIYNKFWTHDMLTEEEQKKSQETYRYTCRITKGYALSLAFSMSGHSFLAMYQGYPNLIMNSWFPEPIKGVIFSTPYYQILLLIQLYISTICTLTGLVQMDNLFVTVITTTLAQFRMLKSKLLSLGNDENTGRKLIKYIDHHNLLFEALKLVEKIFSVLVLHLLASNVMLGVICMLGVLVEDNIIQIIEFNFILVSVFTQLYIYCLLGQFVQDETLSVADAAYNCKWEVNPNSNIRMSLLMTIQRSQKSARLTMGGMLNLCLENFTAITRLMFSILTFMINVKDSK